MVTATDIKLKIYKVRSICKKNSVLSPQDLRKTFFRNILIIVAVEKVLMYL